MNAQPHQQDAARDLPREANTIHGRLRARSAETTVTITALSNDDGVDLTSVAEELVAPLIG